MKHSNFDIEKKEIQKPNRYKVYRNLNKRDGVYFSISFKGKVQGYEEYVLMANVQFKHSTPAALERIRTKHREVCCWVNGNIIPSSTEIIKLRKINADPKKHDHFNIDGKQIDYLTYVLMDKTGMWEVQPKNLRRN